jgi:DHA1 family tetracycline resistance protein-like MFS transporter
MYVSLIPYCLGGLCGPALQGLIANQVPENEQGEIQGLNTSLMSIAAIISPIIMTTLFYQFSIPTAKIYFPGISFFISGILSLLGAIVVYFSIKKINLATNK